MGRKPKPKNQDVYDNLPRIRLQDCNPELEEIKEAARHYRTNISVDCQSGKCPVCGYAMRAEMRGGKVVWVCSCRWFSQGKEK